MYILCTWVHLSRCPCEKCMMLKNKISDTNQMIITIMPAWPSVALPEQELSAICLHVPHFLKTPEMVNGV